MVAVQQQNVRVKQRTSRPYLRGSSLLSLIMFTLLVCFWWWWSAPSSSSINSNDANRDKEQLSGNSNQGVRRRSSAAQSNVGDGDGVEATAVALSDVKTTTCPYKSLQDLTYEERFPRATLNRHIINPPADTKVTLVCCQTTKGPWSVAVHHAWAPNGAARFLEMVTSGYFSHGVPLMRCVKDFICQFGLAGEHSVQFASKIIDDPLWLPAGTENRKNDLDVKRFQRGYLAYAGSGPNSRGRQLFVSMVDQSSLGTSPWEVPWGEIVGEHSYDTLSNIYTGYGEDGPSQESLLEKGGLEVANRDFPDLDWILSCEVVDEIATN